MINIEQYSPEIQQKITASRQAGFSDDQIMPYVQNALSASQQPQQPQQQPQAMQPAQPQASTLNNNPSIGGLVGNFASDVGGLVQGVASIPSLVGQAIKDPAVAGKVASGTITGLYDEYKNLLTGQGEGGTPLLSHAYAHPLNTILDVLPLIQAAKGLSAAGKAGQAAEDVSAGVGAATKYAGKTIGEIGSMQAPADVASTLGTDVAGLKSGLRLAPLNVESTLSEQSIKGIASKLGVKEATLRGDLAAAMEAEGTPFRGWGMVKGGDQAVVDRVINAANFPATETNQGFRDIGQGLKDVSRQQFQVPEGIGKTFSELSTEGGGTTAAEQAAQKWGTELNPLPSIEQEASDIAAGAGKVGTEYKLPSASARILTNRFGLSEGVARRLTANEVSQNMIGYGAKSVKAVAQKSEQALNLLGGIYQKVVNRIGPVRDINPYNVAEEAFSSVGGSGADKELGIASKILYGVDRPTMETAFAPDQISAIRKLEAEAARWQLKADSPLNPDPYAGRLAGAYRTTSNAMLDSITSKIRESGVLDQYKTPEVLAAAKNVSPKLAEELLNATPENIRGLMKTWVRAKQMVELAGKGKAPGLSSTGRYSLPVIMGIGGGTMGGLPGGIAGFLGGTLLQPAADVFTQRAMDFMTPATITAIEMGGKPLSIAGKTALSVLKTPLPIIAGRIAGGTAASTSPVTGKPTPADPATLDLAMQAGYKPQEAAGPQATYPLVNMINDVSRDPKNATYYKWLYDVLYKESLPTSAKNIQARQQGMVNTVASMLPLIDKAKGLGMVSGPIQQFLQQTGAGYDPYTLLLFQRAALVKDSVAAELGRRGASKAVLDNLSAAFPQPNEPANVWRQKVMGLKNILEEYFNIYSSDTSSAPTASSGLGDISSVQMGQ